MNLDTKEALMTVHRILSDLLSTKAFIPKDVKRARRIIYEILDADGDLTSMQRQWLKYRKRSIGDRPRQPIKLRIPIWQNTT